MYRKLLCNKDTYITNKVIGGKSRVSSSVGLAGTLDLFKLHGLSSGSSVVDELTRILIHFDLQPLKDLKDANLIDINHESFFCKLSLKDVYGGQTVPNNFAMSIFPLSSSFVEGLGKDVVYFTYVDAASWLS